jgi:hypothetical protein
MKNTSRGTVKITPLLILLILGVVSGMLINKILNKKSTSESKPITQNPSTPTNTPVINKPTTTPSTSDPKPVVIPKVLLLPVPFTSQAPTANWDEKIYAEGCEEASALMASQYFAGNEQTNLPADFVLTEIKKSTDWEMEKFGYNLDIDTAETARLIKEFYGLNAEVISGFNEQDVKTFLAQGKLVLLPADGRKLGNPNFRAPGPPYHMLVIKGYNTLGFVTNDPGTRKGLNYSYTYETLYEANGNYDHSTESVDLSKKMVLVVWR